MIDDLYHILAPEKSNDIIGRLEHKNTKDAIAGEIELGLLWSISKVANLVIEPVLDYSRNRPDAFSDNLFSIAPALIEITALSDDTFSGKENMERAANIICAHSNRIKRRSGDHLYFQFLEENRFEEGIRRRIRRISEKFEITDEFSLLLKNWLGAPDWPNPPSLRLSGNEIDVVIQWKPYVHPHGRTHTSMPAVADHIEDNPVFKALKKKERQLSKAPIGTLKCIFLGDAGCRMLRELKPLGYMDIRGAQVIQHFLTKSDIDIVIIFSPYRRREFLLGSSRRAHWNVTIFDRTELSDSDPKYDRIRQMVEALPPPQLESYQARSRHRQGMFDLKEYQAYNGTEINSKMGEMSIKLSAKLVTKLLAGRISAAEFHSHAFGDHQNMIDAEIMNGMSIHSAHLEQSGIDNDDDYLILKFGPDWAARRFRSPEAKDS